MTTPQKKPLSSEEKFLSWAGGFLSRLWDSATTVLTLTSGLLYTLATFINGTAKWWLFAVACILSLFTIIITLTQKPPRSELRKEKERYRSLLEHRNTELEDAMKTLARRMSDELDIKNSNTRITIYLHATGSNKEEQFFIPMARYSQNPYWNMAGREKLSDSEGAIASVWRQGFHFKNDYPSDPEKWVKHVSGNEESSTRIPKAVAEKIRMKSCCIAGIRLSHDHHDVGIIIIETTKDTQPWRDEEPQQDETSEKKKKKKKKVRDHITEERGGFANLCEIAAEIIYIIRNSYDDTKRTK